MKKHYLASITTQYDEMEWGLYAIIDASNEKSALRKAEREDWTHGNGIEEQEVYIKHEISEEDMQVIEKHLPLVHIL